MEKKWLGRSLANYKAQHMEKAKREGKLDALLACGTLTEARRILFGPKGKKS